MEFTLLAAAVLAMALAWVAARLTAKDGAQAVFDRVLASTVAGLFAGRIGAMLADGVNPFTDPGDIIILRGGVDTVVASAAAVAWASFAARKDIWPGLDALAIPAVAAMAGWHAGCIFPGTCLGTQSSLPWAFAQEGSAVTRHPTEIYAALALIAGAAALGALLRRRPPAGVLAGSALLVIALARFATEPLRLKIGAGPGWWYAGGAVLGLGAAFWRWRAGDRAAREGH